MIKINVSKDFTDAPGPRYIKQGDFSGEMFREEKLVPAMKKALKNNEKILINLDDTFGYPTSFLEEAFGGLTEYYSKEVILNTIEFKSIDEIGLIDEIKEYIKSDEREKGKTNK